MRRSNDDSWIHGVVIAHFPAPASAIDVLHLGAYPTLDLVACHDGTFVVVATVGDRWVRIEDPSPDLCLAVHKALEAIVATAKKAQDTFPIASAQP